MCLLLSVGAATACGGTGRSREASIASALAKRSEAVARTTGELLWTTGADQRAHRMATVRTPFLLLTAGLDSVHAGLAGKLIGRETVVLVGASGFELPTGIGPVRSRRAYVILLESTTVREALIREVRQRGRPLREGGCWTAPLGEFGESSATPTELCALPVGDSYVLITNVAAGAEEWNSDLSSALASGKTSACERTWPTTTFWAVRSTNSGIDVETGPAGTRKAQVYDIELTMDGPAAEEATVSIGFPTDPTIPGSLSRAAGWPAMRSIQGHQWRTNLRLNTDESADQLFRAMSLLGFGVYL
jgi:hypothetical protein